MAKTITTQYGEFLNYDMAGLGLILLAIILVPVLEGMMTGAV